MGCILLTHHLVKQNNISPRVEFYIFTVRKYRISKTFTVCDTQNFVEPTMQSYLYGVIRKKLFSISDTSDHWKKSEFSRRCRTYNLVTGADPLPLSYERFVGAKAVKLSSHSICTSSILPLVHPKNFAQLLILTSPRYYSRPRTN